MATALAQAYTRDGFVIGADGRETESESHEVISDEVQKIFGVIGGPLAFTFSGAIHITPRDDEKIVLFDFIRETRNAIGSRTMSVATPRTMHAYATKIAFLIDGWLRKAVKKHPEMHFPESHDPQDSGHIVDISIDGYFRERPWQCKITFSQTAQIPRPEGPTVSASVPDYGVYMMGSEAVLSLAVKGDPLFSEFDLSRTPHTLDEAVTAAKRTILVHTTEAALKLDPGHCHTVGGRIHIATITPKDGFGWVVGYEPKGMLTWI
jgi:hypothetical protein